MHLDAFLQMDGKLVKHFKTEDLFPDLADTDVVAFEDLYDMMAQWGTSEEQQDLDYADFAIATEKDGAKNQLDAFKKMTDRVV